MSTEQEHVSWIPYVMEFGPELQRMVDYEDSKQSWCDEHHFVQSWTWNDVAVDTHIIKKLRLAGILQLPFGSGGKRVSYSLADREAVRSLLQHTQSSQPKTTTPTVVQSPKQIMSLTPITLPDDLFKFIIGYDDVKELFKNALTGEQPVHFLLLGPPASAKSAFFMELERLPGTIMVIGGSTSKAGLRDILLECPRQTLIDEIDKMDNVNDLSTLLEWMESGRVIITKHNEHTTIQGRGLVFAACNTNTLRQEYLSRFVPLTFQRYDYNQFIQVATGVLQQREQVSEELAQYIANKIVDKTRDVRDAIKLARLAKTKEQVDQVYNVLQKYK